jgi:hypothetical protein
MGYYSSGWLQGFKNRHGIKVRVVHGESASVNAEIVEDGRRKLREVLREYSPDRIYNMDETGLFFRLEPNKTLATGPVSGTKKGKQRITVALCSNADGTDKLQPLVIAKSARPRCFPKAFDVQSVVQYHHNTKAWMTAVVFTEWLKCLERKMAARNHRILLLLDNAPSHIHSLDLTYVRIEMLPPNTTSHIQPMDAGIIKNFKLNYKTKLMQHYVQEVDEKGSFEWVNLKQAVYFVKDAWTMVTKQTICNCFSHVEIMPTNDPNPSQPVDPNSQQEAQRELSQLVGTASIGNPLSLDEYLNMQEENVTEEPMTDEDIIRLVQGTATETSNEDQESEEDSEESPPPIQPYSLSEAISVCQRLLTTLESHDGFTEQDYSSLRAVIRAIHVAKVKNCRQATLTNYFQRV